MPKFSIIVPIYNVEKYIEQSFESIANQTFRDFEVLCVDDCGTDSSINIAEQYAQNDKRFKIIHHTNNQGVSAARNTALKDVKGEYLVFVDPDDKLELTALEVINNGIIKSGADVIWFNSFMCDKDLNSQTPIDPNFDISDEILYVTPENILQFTGTVWDKAYKTEIVKNLNIEFPAGLIVEDLEFNFKIFASVEKVYRIQTPLYKYRFNRDDSYMTKDKDGGRIRDEFIILENIYNYLIEHDKWEKYKTSMFKKVGIAIKSITVLDKQRHTILNMADKLLETVLH